ncbi:MAG: GNAT family N-acetyltransferase [Hamadaea sp.]|nr:GNAT family N-acetyltransferase [Hamadaea sp.]
MTATGVRRLTGRDEVRALLRVHPERHLLALGDLDDAFWPHTEFHHGHGQTFMIYTALAAPVVVAVADPPEGDMTRLAADGAGLLPDHFYGHLSPEAIDGLRDAYEVSGATDHAYMTLRGPVTAGATTDVVTLGEADLPEITALQAAANPHGGFFEPAMLRAGPYLGVRRKGALVSMAGTHTWSPAERVAVLGNIATHPDHRGQGLAGDVTAALCRVLGESADLIGLTVNVANEPAVRCYRRLGFVTGVTTVGAHLTRRTTAS